MPSRTTTGAVAENRSCALAAPRWLGRAGVLLAAHGIALFLLRAPIARADLYDAPASYYAAAQGKGGPALRDALHATISNQKVISYDNARFALQVLDEDPAHPGNVLLFYDHEDLDVAAINPSASNSGSSIKGWDAGKSWQREHTWPQSRQITSAGASTETGADYSDLFLLRPADATNQSRSNLNYGGSGTAAGVSGGFFFPGKADAGDAARGAFYADVRYDGADANTVDLRLVNGSPASNSGQLGDLASLLKWHYEDPVDQNERRRNDLIYRPDNWSSSSRYAALGNRTFAQGNRNPFIDHPEWVWAVFGTGGNDSKLSIKGATVASDGASSKAIDFGRVIVGGTPASLSASVAVVKAGTDPTYYGIAASGAGTSSITGNYNAFAYNSDAAGKAFTVSLNAATTTAGLKTGSVTIDNLDITTAAAGTGSADGNDTISLSLKVLAHANASFSTAADGDSLALNFGTVAASSSQSKSGAVADLASVADFTAGLDLDSITSAGDAGAFHLSLATFKALSAGASAPFQVTLDTSRAGTFSATYLLHVSDEDLPGASAAGSGELTLTVSGTVASAPEPSGAACLIAIAAMTSRRRR